MGEIGCSLGGFKRLDLLVLSLLLNWLRRAASPPVLSSADARAVAGAAEGVLASLLVEHGGGGAAPERFP